jgi:acyl carrier protein
VERAEVLQVLRDKAVDMLEVEAEQVQEDSSFANDLGADSLSLIEFTMEIEDTLGIELREDEVTGAKTIGAFADLVLARTNPE